MRVVEFPKPKPKPKPNPDELIDVKSLRLGSEILAASPSDPARRRPRRLREPETEAFVHMSLRDFLAGAKVLTGAKELAVWVFILRQWRMSESEPVAVTNASLAAWGVNRQVKYRALAKLTEAGLIKAITGTGRNPRVVPVGVP